MGNGEALSTNRLTRIQFGSPPTATDVSVQFCLNPKCTCKDATLFFYHANALFDTKLFKIILNYETWNIVSTEIFSKDEDCPRLIHEFMVELSEEFKAWLLSVKENMFSVDDIVREDIDYSDLTIGSMVYYSEIYHATLFEQMTFMLEGTMYFVMDYYCANPKCDCADVLLTFQVVKDKKAIDTPVLKVRISFKSNDYEIEEKSTSKGKAEQLYFSFLESIEPNGIDFLQKRYHRIKKWGAEYLVSRQNSLPSQNVSPVLTGRKIGRNEPCPCGSGKKYKKCCGA